MASSLGDLVGKIKLDTRELARGVSQARSLVSGLSSTSADIKVGADVSAAVAKAKGAADRIDSETADIMVSADVAGAVGEAKSAAGRIGAQTADIKVGADTTEAVAKGFAAADRIDSQTADIKVGADTAGASGRLSSFGGEAKGIAAGITAVFGGKLFQGTIVGASDLNEQISKIKVVFGDAQATVVGGADEMASRFGVVKSEFLEAAGGIGLIGKAAGLTQPEAAKLGVDFAKLGADAASFYNVPLDDALDRIRSGLVGEAEPLRQFGVLINDDTVKAEALRLGLAGVGDELTDGQKVIARSSLIMKGLSDAQGDLERTSSGTANQMREATGRFRELGAEIGGYLNPAFNALLGFGNDVLAFLLELPGSAKGAIATGLALGGAYAVFKTFKLAVDFLRLPGLLSQLAREGVPRVGVSIATAGVGEAAGASITSGIQGVLGRQGAVKLGAEVVERASTEAAGTVAGGGLLAGVQRVVGRRGAVTVGSEVVETAGVAAAGTAAGAVMGGSIARSAASAFRLLGWATLIPIGWQIGQRGGEALGQGIKDGSIRVSMQGQEGGSFWENVLFRVSFGLMGRAKGEELGRGVAEGMRFSAEGARIAAQTLGHASIQGFAESISAMPITAHMAGEVTVEWMHNALAPLPHETAAAGQHTANLLASLFPPCPPSDITPELGPRRVFSMPSEQGDRPHTVPPSGSDMASPPGLQAA